jgi:hypothetical protein
VPPTPLREYDGGTFWVLLATGAPVDESRVETVYSTNRYIIFRVHGGLC